MAQKSRNLVLFVVTAQKIFRYKHAANVRLVEAWHESRKRRFPNESLCSAFFLRVKLPPPSRSYPPQNDSSLWSYWKATSKDGLPEASKAEYPRKRTFLGVNFRERRLSSIARFFALILPQVLIPEKTKSPARTRRLDLGGRP